MRFARFRLQAGIASSRRLEQADRGFRHLQRVVISVAGDGGRADYREPAARRGTRDALRHRHADAGQYALQRSARHLPYDHPLAGAYDHVARHLAGRVPEQAVHHVRPGQLDFLAIQARDIGDHLRLDAPDGDEVGQDGQHAEQPGRKRERPRQRRRPRRGLARASARAALPGSLLAASRGAGMLATMFSMASATEPANGATDR